MIYERWTCVHCDAVYVRDPHGNKLAAVCRNYRSAL